VSHRPNGHCAFYTVGHKMATEPGNTSGNNGGACLGVRRNGRGSSVDEVCVLLAECRSRSEQGADILANTKVPTASRQI